MNPIAPKQGSKIVFVNRYFYPDQSATSQMLTDLSFGLAKRGFAVHIVCSRQRYDQPDARLDRRESIGGVTIDRVWTTRFGRNRLLGRAVDYATFYVSSAWRLLGLLRRGDTLVAKTDPPLISIVAMAAAKIKRASLVNWLQDVFPEVASRLGVSRLPPVVDAALRRLRDFSLRAARMNVVLGVRMREILELQGVPEEKISVISNWADSNASEPKPVRESALRSRLGLQDKFIVGYSGNLGRAHEFQTLLDAATALRHDSEILFLMIGGGAGMSQLHQAVLREGLTNFRFLSYQPRECLSDSLAAADVHLVSLLPIMEGLIVPSKFYGMLAAGRPTVFVGHDDGELARVIRTFDTGIVVAVGDAGALAEKLVDLKSNPTKCALMGENGYLLFRDKFTAQRALERWVNVLDPAVGGFALKPPDPAVAVFSREPSSR